MNTKRQLMLGNLCNIVVLFGSLLFVSNVSAQTDVEADSTESETITTLELGSDSEEQTRSRFGLASLELSPIRIAITSGDNQYNNMSGTVVFNLSDPTTEIAIPIFWSQVDGYEDDSEFGYSEPSSNAVVFDVQWRKYNRPARNGGYVGFLARGFIGKSKGSFYYDDPNETDRDPDEWKTDADFGIGAVAGFRLPISSGFYWGANISLTVMANGTEEGQFEEIDLLRERVNISADFLKIGYRF